MSGVTIIGSGLAGLGAAHRFREENIRAVVYEGNSYPGGHTASHKNRHGFIFDEGPHISFTKDQRFQRLLAESAGNEYRVDKAHFNNYWKGAWIKHPAQCNLHGLPAGLVSKIICDFVEETNSEPRKINNYAEWLIASYGKTFAETFPMQYGLKYHTTTADNMSLDWLGPRLYRPSLEELVKGALTPDTDDVHYITDYRYPTANGFATFLNKFIADSYIELDYQLNAIDTKTRWLKFNNGNEVNYDYLVTSVPLPDLIPMIVNVPDDVVQASRRLACSSCAVVNIGLDRQDISDSHVSYFYDRDIIFSRLSFPHMLAKGNVPEGKESIQAEIYFSKKYKPLDVSEEECVNRTIEDLKRCGLVREDDNIIFGESKIIPYANVIFDLDRSEALDIVQGFLEDVGIFSCGRYGEWGYYWTDDSFMSGERAAQKVIDKL